jgi:hypothetical protein
MSRSDAVFLAQKGVLRNQNPSFFFQGFDRPNGVPAASRSALCDTPDRCGKRLAVSAVEVLCSRRAINFLHTPACLVIPVGDRTLASLVRAHREAIDVVQYQADSLLRILHDVAVGVIGIVTCWP